MEIKTKYGYIIKKTYLTEKAAFRADVVQEKQLT